MWHPVVFVGRFTKNRRKQCLQRRGTDSTFGMTPFAFHWPGPRPRTCLYVPCLFTAHRTKAGEDDEGRMKTWPLWGSFSEGRTIRSGSAATTTATSYNKEQFCICKNCALPVPQAPHQQFFITLSLLLVVNVSRATCLPSRFNSKIANLWFPCLNMESRRCKVNLSLDMSTVPLIFH